MKDNSDLIRIAKKMDNQVMMPDSAYSDAELKERKEIFLAGILSDLASVWSPHIGQVPVGRALFVEDKKDVVVECGRKWGKTDIVCYATHRISMVSPNSFSYYFTPQQNQIKEIIWDNNRMPGFLPLKTNVFLCIFYMVFLYWVWDTCLLSFILSLIHSFILSFLIEQNSFQQLYPHVHLS